jgi:hypothetical protein
LVKRTDVSELAGQLETVEREPVESTPQVTAGRHQ